MAEQISVGEVNNKSRNLFLGILFDMIGILSFTVPFLGEFSDVIWAPLAGYLMTWMYKGTLGKIGGVVTFLEEILPFSDFIPTFTLTWIYNYLIKNKNAS
ncbi:hypothetical protein ACNQGB_00770 [Flavobacterium sp. XS1P32]|uniref:hypothetical protein n=1 Tax=unclassified Flavobacterium TaxID=196869 RepID=UPI003AAFCD0F